MIFVDTNLLIYARREELPQHDKALGVLTALAHGQQAWTIAWPCIYEFLRVVTHPRVFAPPTRLDRALEDLGSLFDSPSFQFVTEGSAHFAHLGRMAVAARVDGNLIHDAHIAVLAVEHGAKELLTADGDFARFSDLMTRDPTL